MCEGDMQRLYILQRTWTSVYFWSMGLRIEGCWNQYCPMDTEGWLYLTRNIVCLVCSGLFFKEDTWLSLNTGMKHPTCQCWVVSSWNMLLLYSPEHSRSLMGFMRKPQFKITLEQIGSYSSRKSFGSVLAKSWGVQAIRVSQENNHLRIPCEVWDVEPAQEFPLLDTNKH
jgi:hypothetical protein